MRTSLTVIAIAAWASAALLGCAAPQPQRAEVATGARAEVTEDGLHRLVGAGFKNAWAKPDADFARYEKVALRLVTVRYKRRPTHTRMTSSGESNFALTPSQVERMQRYFRETFEAELGGSGNFELVSEPGPDVLYVEASIIDLVVKVPTDTVSARDTTFTTSTADMTLMLELFDSESGELLGRVVDRQDARQPGRSSVNDLYMSNAVTDTDSVKRVFRRWARILRERLDLMRTAAPAKA